MAGRKLDYLIVNHMEPDHAATIGELKLRYPEVQIVATKRALEMIGQFFDPQVASNSMPVSEGQSLNTGKHNFTFVLAPISTGQRSWSRMTALHIFFFQPMLLALLVL